MGQQQVAHIIILHDEIFVRMDLESLVESVARKFDGPNTQVKVFSFGRDDDAVEHIISHSDSVCLVIQNLTRGFGVHGSNYTSRWAAYRSEARRKFPVVLDGGDFYLYIMDAFIPEAGCIFCTAYGSTEQMNLILQWKLADPRIDLIGLPFEPESIRRAAVRGLERWFERPPVTDLSSESRLIIPVAEEWAAICGSNNKYIDLISPFDFEKLVAAVLKNHGFSVELTAQTRDGGYDIIAVSNAKLEKEVMLVETKRWHASRCIPVGVVRALYGVKQLHKVSRAMLVTTSYVSKDAKREFARVIPTEMELIERDNLLAWCGQYRDDIFGRSILDVADKSLTSQAGLGRKS
jgi:hypothetical protein